MHSRWRAWQDARESVCVEHSPHAGHTQQLVHMLLAGRMRLVPVPQHGLLLAQFLWQPAVTVQLSTANPALLPHNRAKLLQLAEIEDMLKETLQGVVCRILWQTTRQTAGRSSHVTSHSTRVLVEQFGLCIVLSIPCMCVRLCLHAWCLSAQVCWAPLMC